ncbi:MAG: M1 family metallopeptidase [Acidobacteriaceae bacterium]
MPVLRMSFRRARFAMLLLALCSLLAAASAQGASPAPSTYDPRITFAPLTLPTPVNAYRSSNGAPGPKYWQNEADYQIHADLDNQDHVIRGSEIITYTNNSPNALPSLWVRMEQNIYRKDSRGRILANGLSRGLNDPSAPASQQVTNGFILDSVAVGTGTEMRKADYLVNDTRMQIRLAAPLQPHGSQIKIRIRYHYQIPGEWGGRTTWGMSRNGPIYDIAQWYPRMAVYDDLRGWDTLPYIGSEFYLEYGNFDYYVTLPANMIVAGSGELMNPQDVLTPSEITRLKQARGSDKTVYIRTPQEATDGAGRPRKTGTLTWHFHMDHTRDVSWSASPAFIWDAARINLPDNKTALAMSFYPPESAGSDAWNNSTAYVKDTVERFSRHWFPYPWPNAINVAGYTDGMEYPGIVFDELHDKGKLLFWVTAHEIGHSWFPMIVGSNERRHAFMDEGFNTFIDIEESAKYDGGKFGPKRDSEYSAGGEPPDMILKVLDNPKAPTLMALADEYGAKLDHPVSYFKGAYGMVLLREQILGPKRFDWAFRKYIRDWAYKHPSPSDFFREMQSEGGEDLSWFWRGWYMNDWKYDVAVDKIDGNTITISNRGQLVLPTTVQVNFKDGTSSRLRLPVDIWMSRGTYTWTPENKSGVASVTVDPDHVLPDDNRSNNSMKAP